MRLERNAQKYQNWFEGHQSQYRFSFFDLIKALRLVLKPEIRISWSSSWSFQQLECNETFVFSNTCHVYLPSRSKPDSGRAVHAVAHLRPNYQHGNLVYDSLQLKGKAPGERPDKHEEPGVIWNVSLFCLQLYTRAFVIKVFGLDDIAVCVALVCPNPAFHWSHK